MNQTFIKRNFSEELVREFPNMVLLEPRFNNCLIGITDDGRAVYFEEGVMHYLRCDAIEEFSDHHEEGTLGDSFLREYIERNFDILMDELESSFGERAPVMCLDDELLQLLHRLSKGGVADFYE